MNCVDRNKGKELEKLTLGDLNACGCDACAGVAKDKRLEFLETYYEETEREKNAAQKGKEMAKQFKEAIRAEEEANEDRAMEVFHNELQRDGIDLNKIHGLRTVVQKMNFDMTPRKRVYTNGGRHRKQDLTPESMDFLHWMTTGQMPMEKLDWYSDDDSGSGGGVVVPEELHNQIIETRDQGSIMRRAGVQRFTMNSNTMRVPVEANVGSAEIQISQGTQASGTEPTLEEVKLEPLSWFHEIIPSVQMLRDSAVPLAEYFTRVFGRSMAKLENQKFANGSGTDEPEGLAQNASIPSIAEGATTAQTILNTYYGLDAANRNVAAWFFHGSALAKIAEELGETWFTTYADGQPSRLFGRPVFELNDLPNEDTSDGDIRSVFFGDPEAYFLGEPDRLIVNRSDHAYWQTNRVAFKAEQRLDSKVGKPSGFVKSAITIAEGSTA